MNQRPALIWDFDGTLAYQEGKWSGAMLAAMNELAPGHGLTLKDVRPLMHSGFPWDEPEKLHPELTDPQAWWTFLEAYLVRVALALGFTGDQAQRIARRVHRVQADSRSYHLYPDTLATLDRLKREGYRMIILSNHVPELPQIVRGLGLTDAFEAVLGSAQTAVEKPHPQAFRLEMETLGNPTAAVMIGDNPIADGQGALQAGLQPLLVHGCDECTSFWHCGQLCEIPALLASKVQRQGNNNDD